MFNNERGLNKPTNKPGRLCSIMRGLNKPKNKPPRLCSIMREDWTNQRTNLTDFVQQWERTERRTNLADFVQQWERTEQTPKNKPCRLCSAMKEDWTNQRTNLPDFVQQWERTEQTIEQTCADFVQQWERTEQTKEQTLQTLFSNERGLNKPKNKPCRLCSAMKEDWTNQRTNLPDFVQQWERTEQTKEQTL